MLPLPATIPQAILETVLGRLALLFLTGSGGDLTTAREAAHQMVASYSPQTAAELTLVAEIIGFGLHALEALGQAANPDLSLNRVLRLRGSAVSLSREAHKSRRKLDQLQRARASQQPEQASLSPQPEPTPDHLDTRAADPIEADRLATRTEAKTWLRSYNERQTAERVAKQQAQAEHAGTTAPLNPLATDRAISAAA